MEILQIRAKSSVSTYSMAGLSGVEINVKEQLENHLVLSLGTGRQKERNITLSFEKSEEELAKIRKLYNEVLVSLVGRLTSKYALVVNVGSSNMVESWRWLDTNQRDQLVIPVDKKYKVGISYGFDVELEVTAASEEEAYKKAKDGINSGKYADEINDAVQGSCETCHSVDEIQ